LTGASGYRRFFFHNACSAKAGNGFAITMLLRPQSACRLGAFSSESLPRIWSGVDTRSRKENASNQRDGASVPILSERKRL
jgi:hypothetical protein